MSTVEGNKEKAEKRRLARLRAARNRKIKRRLARLRKIRTRIKELEAGRPKRWQARIRHLKRVAGKVRRELKDLGYKFPKKKRGGDPLEETDEQEADEREAAPGKDPDEGDGNADDGDGGDDGGEGGNDASDDGAGCDGPDCEDYNWIHGDTHTPRPKLLDAVKNLGKGLWNPPIALGTQGKLTARPGQRAMVTTVKPGLFIVQFVPSSMVPSTGGEDELGVLPLLLLPGIAQGIRTTFSKVPEPQPGQLGHPATPPVPRPAASPNGVGGPRGRRRRREDEETEEAPPARRRRRQVRR